MLYNIFTELAPGASFPLPMEPPEVTKVRFKAKTDSGTSLITIMFYNIGVGYSVVDEILRDITITLPVALAAMGLQLKNEKGSTIFFRDLTTE